MKHTLTWLGVVFLISCTKTDLFQPGTKTANEVCYNCSALAQQYADSFEHPVVLGRRLGNPYLIPNMVDAYKQVYHKDPGKLGVSHLYIRFRPSNMAELDALERADIDLFDHPLDQEVISEGEYYEESNTDEEQIPAFYAVVPKNTVLPGQISRDLLAEMFIPDNDPRWEDEALRRTGNLFDDGELGPKSRILTADLQASPTDSHYPSGKVQVRKILRTDNGLNPVSDVLVLVHRLFKTERLRTNAQGEFQGKKYFRNKYNITIKFKNDLVHISRVRPRKIFEQFFPIKINFGKWDNLSAGHQFIIEHQWVTATTATSHWCAATTFIAVQQFRKLCQQNDIARPRLGLHIMLSSKKGSNHGNTYMLQGIMEDQDAALLVTESVVLAVCSVFNPITAVAAIATNQFLKQRAPDIAYGYGGNPYFLTTDKYNELVMHELAHASHYTSVGAAWWVRFGYAEANNKGEGSYGRCCTSLSDIIALGESWAYTIGHYFTDKVYGLESTPFPEQGLIDQNVNVLNFQNEGIRSSHLIFLESYNPHRTEDLAAWIPKGLFYDLMDENEQYPASGIVDNTSGYTLHQINQCLTRDTKDLAAFRETFIHRYGILDQDNIRNLFRQYGY